MTPTTTKPKVLIVDDEPSILASISDLLESEFDVMTSVDPKRALEDLVAQDVAVLISDQRMPKMNGDEFLRNAKERSTATRVLLTGFADIEALARVVNDGKIYAYVTKPWDPLDLRNTVRNAASEYRLLSALRHERELLYTLANNIPDCIYVQDSAQRYTMVNKAFADLAGLADPQDAVGKTERECLPGEFGVTAWADGRGILESGEPIIAKCDELAREDGTVRWYSSTRIPVHGSSDEMISALVGISRDVTEQKQTENNLRMAKELAEETIRAKQEFLARTSHEIRTPLNSILGMVDLLVETGLSERQRKYVDIFRANSETLMRMMSDLLDLSRSDLRELRLEASEFSLRATVTHVIKTLEKEAGAKGLTLKLSFQDNVPEQVVGDAGRLKQILINLVGNALKFTHHGGVDVTVAAESSDNLTVLLHFAVEDTGIGIADDKLLDVFEPFSQVQQFATSPYGGSGLGLTICRQLVRQMEGTIWVESLPGIGSTFRFTVRFQIPVPLPYTADQQIRQSAAASDISISNLRILLAEDNLDNVFLIQAYLGPGRIEVASNGREAVDKFLSDKFDIVLMDLQMPEMDGVQATRLIREWEQANAVAATPVLACTAHSSAEEVSPSAGFSGHLIKPISKAMLLAAITACLGVQQ